MEQRPGRKGEDRAGGPRATITPPHAVSTRHGAPPSAGLPVAFVLVAPGLDALGVGIIAPVVPRLVQDLSHLPPNRAAPWAR